MFRCYCCASPHSARRYPGPGEKENTENIPLNDRRRFGKYRPGGGVLVPDDIAGLPSTQIRVSLESNPDPILYEAEIDQGRAMRGLRVFITIMTVLCVPISIFASILQAFRGRFGVTCDEACCWLRKEYASRSWFRLYSDRIETNFPKCRFFGWLGFGSWSADEIRYHPFDRGAFGFRRVPTLMTSYFGGVYPIYGWDVARQRCQWNGPPWHGGCWCDEWVCAICFCSFRYDGLADPDETAFAASLALQAYFEGRSITKDDMDQCLEYWRNNISERHDPVNRKRDICCEPLKFPIPTGVTLYQCCHFFRNVPYAADDDRNTEELRMVYDRYNELSYKQIKEYKEFTGPHRFSTLCRACGCRRVFGRHGLFFCTEGCSDLFWLCKKKPGDPPPPFNHRDLDDENDASVVLRKVLGDPPANVLYTRWVFDEEKNENVLVTYPRSGAQSSADIEMGNLDSNDTSVASPKLA